MQTVRVEFPESRDNDLLLEQFIRKTIHKVKTEILEKIAVVCGAWHSSALNEQAISGKLKGCKIDLPPDNCTSVWLAPVIST